MPPPNRKHKFSSMSLLLRLSLLLLANGPTLCADVVLRGRYAAIRTLQRYDDLLSQGKLPQNNGLQHIMWIVVVLLLRVTAVGSLVDALLSYVAALSALGCIVFFLLELSNVPDSENSMKWVEGLAFSLSAWPFLVPWVLAYYFPVYLLYSALGIASLNVLAWQAAKVVSGQHSRTKVEVDNEVDFLMSPNGLQWCNAFLFTESFVVLLACIFSFIWDQERLETTKAVVIISTSSCLLFVQAFWLSYAAGGWWLHFNHGWRFFQPLRGGWKFMLLQATCWSMYAIATCLTFVQCVEEIQSPLWDLAQDILPRGSIAFLILFAQTLMVLSLLCYENPAISNKELQSSRQLRLGQGTTSSPRGKKDLVSGVVEGCDVLAQSKGQNRPMVHFLELIRLVLITIGVFILVKPEGVVAILTAILTACLREEETGITVRVVIITALVLYSPTYFGQPQLTGIRRRWYLRGSIASEELARYFRVHTIRESMNPLDEKCKYVFGYHPHGMFPMGMSYCHSTSQWLKLFHGIAPFGLVASIMHRVPFLRDGAQMTGSLEITKRGFKMALDKFGSVILVPGGQDEMLLFPEDESKEDMVSTKHKGFIRFALHREAADTSKAPHYLVPVFAFGEKHMLRNIPIFPLQLQKWSVRNFRTNMFFFPIGRFGLPAVPKKVKITFAVGEPIAIPKIQGRIPYASDAQIDLLHRLYYSEVVRLFDKYKSYHGQGYEKMKLTLVPSIKPITRKQFSMDWETIKTECALYSDQEIEEHDHAESMEYDSWPWQEHLVTLLFLFIFTTTPYYLVKAFSSA